MTATDTPDRRTPEYRQHIRKLAQAKRPPRADRKPRDRGRPAPTSMPYPLPVDNDIGTSDD